MKKILIIILSIALIALVIIWYFDYKAKINNQLSTSTMITEWKTYSDDKQRYIIKYPDGWYINSHLPNNIYIQNYLDSQITEEEEKMAMLNSDKISIVLEVYPNTITKNEDLINWLKKNDRYTSGMSGDPTSVKQVIISEYKGFILSYTEADVYVFSAGDYVFGFYFHPYNSKLKPVFNQILSTFELKQ